MIKDLKGTKGRSDQLISFVDLAPTMLSLAHIEAPVYMEGNAFLGDYKAEENTHVFASSDRFDEFTDRIRAVRTKEFLFLKNDFPEKPKYKDVGYRKNVPMMTDFLELKDQGKLNKEQQIWFISKTNEELYNCKKDPHNLVNLAEDPSYASVLKQMRSYLLEQQKKAKDFGKQPEAELINTMWPDFKQPKTLDVIVDFKNDMVSLSTKTRGASIAYRFSNLPNETLDYNKSWNLYSSEFKKSSDYKYLYVV